MVRFAYILLGVPSGGVADAFHMLSSSRVTCDGQRNQETLPTASSNKFEQNNKLRLSLSKDDNDSGWAEEINSLDTDLALEIEEALSLAQDALAVEVSKGGDDVDEIANMPMEKPPIVPPQLPVPPKEDPPASLVSLSLEEGVDENVQPFPPESPESPPPVAAAKIGETLKNKAAEEIERLKNLIFGLEEEMGVAESSIVEAEDTAAALKKEIEDSMLERETMVKQIENEYTIERELLVAQMWNASAELKDAMDQAMDQSEKELIFRIDSFKATIDEVTAEVIDTNSDKERIQQSKQSLLDKVIQNGTVELVQFKKSSEFDIAYAKRINEDLARRADAAEGEVQGVYDQINQMRSERVSLQQQIVDVEKNALEDIETLQREQGLDDARYATALQKERDRMDSVIDAAYQAYAIKVCEKKVERQAVEADYQEKVQAMDLQIIPGKKKQEARVKEYLDKLEEKHKKQRIIIYQEKFEAISAVRKQMSKDLAIEDDKIEEIHKTMQAKIGDVQKKSAQMEAEFEKEMSKKHQRAKEEEDELLREIEDVRVDMTYKMKTQQGLYEGQKATYLEENNAKISQSDSELRQKWRELADITKSYNGMSAKRDSMRDDVAEKQALIESYERDRKSFRKTLRVTARVAREKIGTKARRLLRREKKKIP